MSFFDKLMIISKFSRSLAFNYIKCRKRGIMSFIDLVQVPIATILETGKGDETTALWWPSKRDKTQNNQKTRVIFMVPGNPGIPEYYTDFLTYLHKQLRQQFDIIIVGHLGHNYTTADKKHKNIYNRVFSLQEQVLHQQECFKMITEKYPKDTEYFMIGHSIGAWLCEQVFKTNKDSNIIQVFSLTPAICDFMKSPHGSWMAKSIFLPPVQVLLAYLVLFISWLPSPLISFLISMKTPNELFARITSEKLLNPAVARNALSMGRDETKEVCELDSAFYQSNYDKFTFYYTPGDGYAPESYYNNLKKQVPKANAMLGTHNIQHSFVAHHSKLMASLVAHWMSRYL